MQDSPAHSHSSNLFFSPPLLSYERDSALYSSPYGVDQADQAEARLLHPLEPDFGYFPRVPSAAPTLKTSSMGSDLSKEDFLGKKSTPVESGSMTVVRVVLPAVILPLITGCSWAWATMTMLQTISMPAAVIGEFTTKAALSTYSITLVSSILAILVSWSFGRSASYLISKRVARKACTVDELGSWVYLSTHQIRWSFGKWVFITGIATILLSLQVSGFNSLLTPQPFIVRLAFLGRQEVSYSTSEFDSFYTTATSASIPCFWPDARGISTPSCAFSSGFFEMLLGGRSNVETQLQKRTTYSRVGRLNIEGPTAGVLPFTSISRFPGGTVPSTSNTIDDGTVPKVAVLSSEISKLKVDFYLNTTVEGVSADISCRWSDSSPLESAYGAVQEGDTKMRLVTSTAPSCGEYFNLVQYAPETRASSVACQADDGQWSLYIRLFAGYVITTDENVPGASQENLTCSVTPFLATYNTTFWSKTSTTTVNRNQLVRSTAAPSRQLQANFNAHVADLQRALNNILAGPTAEANLVVEAVNSLRPGVTKEDTQRTWELLLTGMLELDATFARHTWETLVRQTDSFDGWRRVPAVLSYAGFGWQSEWTTLLLLGPLTVLCLVSVAFVVAGLMTPGNLLSFDPSDVGRLVLATARGDLGSAASETDRHDAAVLSRARIRFRPPMGGGGTKPWGLYR